MNCDIFVEQYESGRRLTTKVKQRACREFVCAAIMNALKQQRADGINLSGRNELNMIITGIEVGNLNRTRKILDIRDGGW